MPKAKTKKFSTNVKTSKTIMRHLIDLNMKEINNAINNNTPILPINAVISPIHVCEKGAMYLFNARVVKKYVFTTFNTMNNPMKIVYACFFSVFFILCLSNIKLYSDFLMMAHFDNSLNVSKPCFSNMSLNPW